MIQPQRTAGSESGKTGRWRNIPSSSFAPFCYDITILYPVLYVSTWVRFPAIVPRDAYVQLPLLGSGEVCKAPDKSVYWSLAQTSETSPAWSLLLLICSCRCLCVWSRSAPGLQRSIAVSPGCCNNTGKGHQVTFVIYASTIYQAWRIPVQEARRTTSRASIAACAWLQLPAAPAIVKSELEPWSCKPLATQ
jgi:hypothetical protein